MLRNLLNRIRSKPEKAETDHDSGKKGISATGVMLRELLQSCPVCKRDIKGHSFAYVASTIVNESQKPIMASLFASVIEHEWNRLIEFNDFDVQADNLVVCIVKGNHTNGTILVVKDVVELFASNNLLLVERISGADIAAISSQLPLKWEQM